MKNKSLLHISLGNDGHRGRRITILDGDKVSIYIVDSKRSAIFTRLSLNVYRPGRSPSRRDASIGSAKYHLWTRTVDLQVGSSTITMKAKGFVRRSMTFQSSVGRLTWQHESLFRNGLRLVDAGGTLLARFESTSFSRRKTRTLEISDAVRSAPGLLDEVVISGIAVVEAERRQNENAVAASGAPTQPLSNIAILANGKSLPRLSREQNQIKTR
ncbi:hypothetical protein MMC07_007633 [Pseudocyphellaria aurata]|nr:hypothetical protein [Pseudocyphellaria aurata]